MRLLDVDPTRFRAWQRVVLAAFVSAMFAFVFAALIFFSMQLLQWGGGVDPALWPHMQWRGYTADDLRNVFESVGPSSWSFYATATWVDFIVALLFGVMTLYALALMGALSRVGARRVGGWRTASIPVTVLGAIALIADVIENILLLFIVYGVPDDADAPSATLTALASSATQVKIGAYVLALIVFAYLTLDFVFRLSARRMSENRTHAAK